ncbi:MAG: hypothetical protein ACI9HK_000369 [Pirellulaceae bacterium]
MSDSIELKTIAYRGGVVTFRVPADWIEEYEESGGGAFYADADDSPTLRLNIIDMESPRPVDENTPIEILGIRATETGGEVIRLDAGNAVIAYQVGGDDESAVFYYWELANAVLPQHATVAVFSLEISHSKKSQPEIAELLKLVDCEIRACEFGHL